jgi:hypothetical protein
MKVWPIDPLVPRNLRLEVPEKLPQGLTNRNSPRQRPDKRCLVRHTLYNAWVCSRKVTRLAAEELRGQNTWMRGTLARLVVAS